MISSPQFDFAFCDRKMTMEHQRLVTSGTDTHLMLDVTEIRYDNKNNSCDKMLPIQSLCPAKRFRIGAQMYCDKCTLPPAPWDDKDTCAGRTETNV